MTTRTQDPAAEATPENPESPETTQASQRPKVLARAMGWSPGSPPPASLDAETAAGSDVGADSPESSDAPPASRSSRTGGSRTSSRVDDPAHVEKAIHAAVIGGTEAAHEFLVHDPVAKDVELLLADDEDAAGIAKPSANLLARRLTSGINNPDLADGIELAIAVGMYVSKQLRKLREVRRARRAQQATLEEQAALAGEPA